VNTTMTITNVTFEDVLAVVGPPAGPLQLGASGWEDEYAFFRKIATGDWRELRNEKVQPGFWRFLTTRPSNVAFSPCGWSAPSEHSALVSTRCLWAGIRLGLGAQGRHQPAPDIVPETEVTVRAKLAGAALPPSLTVHEGDHRPLAADGVPPRFGASPLFTPSVRVSARWRSGSDQCPTRARGGARHPLRTGAPHADGPRRDLGAYATVPTYPDRALARPRTITMMDRTTRNEIFRLVESSGRVDQAMALVALRETD
jgi:hypothetical protein